MRTGVDTAGRKILDHGVAMALLANGPAEYAEAEAGRVIEVFLAD